MKEPLVESIKGLLGQTILPGDKVFTFTQTYGRSTRICSGIFRGLVREKTSPGFAQEYYVIERADGKHTRINYNNLVLAGTQLEELDDKIV